MGSVGPMNTPGIPFSRRAIPSATMVSTPRGKWLPSNSVDPMGIIIEVMDDGPGIENIELALQEGYSTASVEYREMGFGAGLGLPNIKNNADLLEIDSKMGGGTHLKMCFWLNRSDEQGTDK